MMYISLFLKIIDWLLALVIIPPAFVMKLFSKLGPQRLPVTRLLLRKIGIFPIKNHYYWPLFNFDEVEYTTPRYDFEKVFNPFESEELAQVLAVSDEANFYICDKSKSFDENNQAFGPVDAEVLYSFLITQKPKRIIEIGGGHTTNIIRDANKFIGQKIQHICIEPFEFDWLDKFEDVEVIRSKVEDIDLAFFELLEEGDLLFIDSSHIIRPANDVLYEYLHILPTLKSGVYIHIHDIFSPYEYLEHWHKEYNLMWNEMYLIEAILLNSRTFDIKIPNFYLSRFSENEFFKCYDRFKCKNINPGSIYIRKN